MQQRWKFYIRLYTLIGVLCIGYVIILSVADKAYDLETFWYASRNILKGSSVYSMPVGVSAYIYPPILAVLLISMPSLNIMWFIWGIATIICFFMALKVILEYTLTSSIDSDQSFIIILLNLVNFVLFDHLSWAQLQVFMLLGMLISWRYLKNNKQVASGIIIGFIASIKIFPAFMVFIMLIRGYRKAFLYAVVSGILFTVVGFAVAGWDSVGQFLNDVPIYTSRLADTSYYNNVSISGTLIYNNIVSNTVAHYINNAIRELCGVLFIYILIKNTYTIDEIFSLIMTLIIIVSPFAWSHYIVLLYFPMNYALKTKSIHKGVLIWVYCITNLYIAMVTTFLYKLWAVAGLIHFVCAVTILGLYLLQARAIIMGRTRPAPGSPDSATMVEPAAPMIHKL